MGINKKRIAQRQQAQAKAEKDAKSQKAGLLASYIAAGVLGLVIIALVIVIVVDGTKKSEPEKVSQVKDCYADIVIESYGTITVELDADAAPITVQNFVKLANEGFYHGLTFHRIIKDFMMQGGCPEGNGTGDSGTEIKGEFAENGWNNPIKHERGVISMARGNLPDSGSCQFFIVHRTSPHLDGKYAAFGRVISGMEIVDKICNGAKPIDDNGTIPAANQPKILSITIREK